MVALKLTALFAILSTLALAAPVAEDATAEGTVIPLTKRSPHKPDTLYTRDGIPKADLAWLKAQEGHLAQKMHVGATQFEANTGKKLAFMDHKEKREENLAKRAAAGEALTAEQGGSYWQGPISIGTPGQSFQMDFDTVRRFHYLIFPSVRYEQGLTDNSLVYPLTGIVRYLGPRYQL
jgi:cathepsin D